MKRSGILGSSWPYISGPLLFVCEDFQAWLDQVDDDINIQMYRYTDVLAVSAVSRGSEGAPEYLVSCLVDILSTRRDAFLVHPRRNLNPSATMEHFCGHSSEGWGPRSPLRSFDLTPCFESTVLFAIPSALLVTFGIPRILKSRRSPIFIRGSTSRRLSQTKTVSLSFLSNFVTACPRPSFLSVLSRENIETLSFPYRPYDIKLTISPRS